MKRSISRPDLSVGEGCIIDAAYLPAKLRADWVAKWLSHSKLTPVQSVHFMDFVNDWLQCHPLDLTPATTERREIDRVRSEARRLRAAIEAMGRPARETLQAHTDYLAFGSRPPVQLPEAPLNSLRVGKDGSLLETLWDWVHAVELGAEYAGAQIHVTRQDKPAQHSARTLIALLADKYKEATGEWPPADRSSWFAGFSEEVGGLLKLSVGPRIVASGIAQAKKHTLMAAKTKST